MRVLGVGFMHRCVVPVDLVPQTICFLVGAGFAVEDSPASLALADCTFLCDILYRMNITYFSLLVGAVIVQ